MLEIQWLAFVDERGVERWRLFDIPPDWLDLPPARLEMLRQRAEPATEGVRVAHARVVAQRKLMNDPRENPSRSAKPA